MDTWKFYDITHREHVVCNPTSEEKLARLVELLRLPTDAQVADIACGKGEFLIRLAEAYRARVAGIDISPFHIADAKHRLEARAPNAGITFTQKDGADFTPDAPHTLDLASSLGASWIFGGHAGTLDALISRVKPGDAGLHLTDTERRQTERVDGLRGPGGAAADAVVRPKNGHGSRITP